VGFWQRQTAGGGTFKLNMRAATVRMRNVERKNCDLGALKRWKLQIKQKFKAA